MSDRARDHVSPTRTNAEGLGRGLAICDNLVRGLDARLELDNAPGGGARVTLYLHSDSPGTAFPGENHF